MATIERFEEIDAWKKARELTRLVYDHSRKGDFSRDFGLKDQMRRACVSIMLNIAEGFERDGNAEFRQFLAIAKASVGEVRSALYVALDAQFIDDQTFQILRSLAEETGRLINGFMRYLAQTESRGRKFIQDEPI